MDLPDGIALYWRMDPDLRQWTPLMAMDGLCFPLQAIVNTEGKVVPVDIGTDALIGPLAMPKDPGDKPARWPRGDG